MIPRVQPWESGRGYENARKDRATPPPARIAGRRRFYEARTATHSMDCHPIVHLLQKIEQTKHQTRITKLKLATFEEV
jgi:hypothetical protein